MLDQLTDSLNWKIGTTDLDNQTAFRALELMWWLDSSDWNMLYDTLSIGTSYSQETIRFVRFIHFNGNIRRPITHLSVNELVYLQTLFLGFGTASRIGLFRGIHPGTNQHEESNQFPCDRTTDDVSLPRPISKRETP